MSTHALHPLLLHTQQVRIAAVEALAVVGPACGGEPGQVRRQSGEAQNAPASPRQSRCFSLGLSHLGIIA